MLAVPGRFPFVRVSNFWGKLPLSRRSSFLAASGGGVGAILVGTDTNGGYGTLAIAKFCTGYDSFLDNKKLHGVHEHLDMVIDWALENISVHQQMIVDVAPCGENEHEKRLLVRAQRCFAAPTQPPRKGDAVCALCWNATDECLQKSATSLIRQYAVGIYQHAVVGEQDKALKCWTSLANLKILEPGRPASLRKEYDKIKDMRFLDLGTHMKNIYNSTHAYHLTGHGRAVKQFMLEKVFCELYLYALWIV